MATVEEEAEGEIEAGDMDRLEKLYVFVSTAVNEIFCSSAGKRLMKGMSDGLSAGDALKLEEVCDGAWQLASEGEAEDIDWVHAVSLAPWK